ncbi:hypothetical protein WR25_08801 [Diploscapter pachys]|uniref:Uncharacterized protein n=1 Tax=Diploscapter pachys TaxID=2018661 RepID=A0A2A2L248_9BILA|nr:hypothetical protein WR25_08801 [Diploscapter pachys]
MTSTREQLTERIDEADGMRMGVEEGQADRMDVIGAAEPHTPSNQQTRRIQDVSMDGGAEVTPKNTKQSSTNVEQQEEEMQSDDEENTSHTDNEQRMLLKHQTPAAVRNRRIIQKELHMSSPSDSMLSPCTSKLMAKVPHVSSFSLKNC